MLAADHRITSGADYKRLVRRGRRVVGAVTVAYTQSFPETEQTRFGFIIARNVGNAVIRNRVRRRLKAATYAQIADFPAGTEVVFRAFPSAADSSFSDLAADVAQVAGRLRVA